MREIVESVCVVARAIIGWEREYVRMSGKSVSEKVREYEYELCMRVIERETDRKREIKMDMRGKMVFNITRT